MTTPHTYTAPVRKPRSDSVLDNLPREQQAELLKWLMEENVSLAEARQRLLDRFNVQISLMPISTWRRRHRTFQRLDSVDEQMQEFESCLPITTDAVEQKLHRIASFLALQQIGDENISQRQLATILSYSIRCRNATLREKALEHVRERLSPEQRRKSEEEKERQRIINLTPEEREAEITEILRQL